MSNVAILLGKLGDRRSELGQVALLARNDDHERAPNHERGAAGGAGAAGAAAGLLAGAGKARAFLGAAFVVRGWATEVRAAALGAETVPTGVVCLMPMLDRMCASAPVDESSGKPEIAIPTARTAARYIDLRSNGMRFAPLALFPISIGPLRPRPDVDDLSLSCQRHRGT